MNDSGIGKRITRYGTILSISGMVCKLLLLVYTVLAVNILGQDKFGRIEYFIEIAVIFTVLFDFGLEQTVTREVARRRETIHRILAPLLTYRFLVSLMGVVVFILFLLLTGKANHTLSLILCTATYFFVVLNLMTARALVRSFEWLGTEGAANIVEKVIQIGLAVLFLYFLPKLPLIVLCYTAGMIAAFSIYVAVLFRHFSFSTTGVNWRLGWEWQKIAVMIGLAGSCIMLLHRQDTAMVNWISGDAETGLYRAPYRFLEGLFLFPQVLAISAYPVFSKLFHEGRPFSETAALLLRGLMILCLPITIGGTVVASEMIPALLSSLEPGGDRIFQILLWALPFVYANFLLGTILVATDRQKWNLIASVCGLLCNAVLNIPAIYWYGAYGASVVTIVSQGLYCFLLLVYTRNSLSATGLYSYISILVACAVMAFVLRWTSCHWTLDIGIGAMVYGITLLITGGMSRKDIHNMVSIIRKPQAEE
ncbi:oligosaccharide flippase family protein [bacterium]|nr:oligosaccharide flippase family protein [bacterium]